VNKRRIKILQMLAVGLGTLELSPTYGLAWSQREHRVKTYCLSQSYLSFTLTARTAGRDNCRVRQARLHSPCGLAQPMNTFPS
jgi:hypothetical protein